MRMSIQLFRPVLVDCAPRRVRAWGNFQFPTIHKHEGKYYYHFHDAPDNFQSYGSEGWTYVSDASLTHWEWCRDEEAYRVAQSVLLPSGDRVYKRSLASAKVDELTLPEPVDAFTINRRHYVCYPNDQLPPEVGGLSMMRKKAGESEWHSDVALMHETGGIRGAVDGLVPAMQARGNKFWMGPDNALYLLCYNFKFVNGKADPRDWVYLMRSEDNGKNFYEWGTIPFEPDLKDDPMALSDDRRGFLEPEMCFLTEKDVVCVIRTTHIIQGPMYICFSSDGGKSWTKPRVFHTHGVYPHLQYLRCGALVISYGRPGVDMMVSWDGGKTWGEPINIVPALHAGRNEDSCGYTQMAEVDSSSLVLAYSDFNYDPGDGYPRKALMSRIIRIV